MIGCFRSSPDVDTIYLPRAMVEIVLRAASNAAWTLGARNEIWEAWAERLIDKETADDAFQSLKYVIQEVDSQEVTGSGSNMNLAREDLFELRARWRNFLQSHRGALISGKRFSYRDPVIKPLMVSAKGERIFDLSLPDGRMWPER